MLVLTWGVGTLGSVYSQESGSESAGNPGQMNTSGALASEASTGNFESQDETQLLFSDTQQGIDTSTPVSIGTFGLGELIRMVLVLGGVLLLIYGIFWFIKRAKEGPATPDSLMKIRDHISLGGSRSLYLVQLADRWFMMGATDGSLNLLTEINDSDTVQEIQVQLAQRGTVPPQSFAGMMGSLSAMIGRSPKTNPQPQNHNSSDMYQNTNESHRVFTPGDQQVAFDFIQAQKERLKKW